MREWMNKMWYVHAKEYYSVIQSNKGLIHSITIMLSGTSERQTVTHWVTVFI